MALKDKIKTKRTRKNVKAKLFASLGDKFMSEQEYPEESTEEYIHGRSEGDGIIKVKTPRREYELLVGDITANEAIERVKKEYPTFTELEYKTITYKKTGAKGEFIKRIYSPEKIEQRWQKKKDHIRELSENISKLKNNITRDLNNYIK